MSHPWDTFAAEICQKLTNDDDERLWQSAVNELFRDARFLCEHSRTNSLIFTRIGSCSHWLSPHNNGSWLQDARYAWPSGYGGSGWSIRGLPELDWSLSWQWEERDKTWVAVEEIHGKRPLIFRVAVPSRSARHQRAVVHALWTPGSPTVPKKKLLQAYGFTKVGERWECTSTFGRKKPYEVT